MSALLLAAGCQPSSNKHLSCQLGEPLLHTLHLQWLNIKLCLCASTVGPVCSAAHHFSLLWESLVALAGSPFLEQLAAALHPQHGTVIINLHGGGRPRPTISSVLGRLLGMSNDASSRGYVLSSTQGQALQQTLQLFRWGLGLVHMLACFDETWQCSKPLCLADEVLAALRRPPGSVSTGGHEQYCAKVSGKAATLCCCLQGGAVEGWAASCCIHAVCDSAGQYCRMHQQVRAGCCCSSLSGAGRSGSC